MVVGGSRTDCDAGAVVSVELTCLVLDTGRSLQSEPTWTGGHTDVIRVQQIEPRLAGSALNQVRSVQEARVTASDVAVKTGLGGRRGVSASRAGGETFSVGEVKSAVALGTVGSRGSREGGSSVESATEARHGAGLAPTDTYDGNRG